MIGLLEGARRQVELYIFGLFAGFGLILLAVAGELVSREDIDTLGVNCCEEIIEIVGRIDIAGEEVVYLAEGEIPLLFPCVDELIYIVFVLIKFFCHGSAHSCELFKRLGGRPDWGRTYPLVVP